MNAEDYQKQPSLFSRLSKTAVAGGVRFLAKQAAKKGVLYLGRAAAAAGSAGTTILVEGALRLGKKIPGILKKIKLNLALSSPGRSQDEEKTLKLALLTAVVGLPLLLVALVIFSFMLVGSSLYVASGRGGVIPKEILDQASRITYQDYENNPDLISLRADAALAKATQSCGITAFTQRSFTKKKKDCLMSELTKIVRIKEAKVIVDQISNSVKQYNKLQCVGYLKALKKDFRNTWGNAVDYYYKNNLPDDYQRQDFQKGMEIRIGDVLVWPGEEGNCEENIRACGHIAVVVGIRESNEIKEGERYIITTQAEGSTGEIVRLMLAESSLENTNARIITKK